MPTRFLLEWYPRTVGHNLFTPTTVRFTFCDGGAVSAKMLRHWRANAVPRTGSFVVVCGTRAAFVAGGPILPFTTSGNPKPYGENRDKTSSTDVRMTCDRMCVTHVRELLVPDTAVTPRPRRLRSGKTVRG